MKGRWRASGAVAMVLLAAGAAAEAAIKPVVMTGQALPTADGSVVFSGRAGLYGLAFNGVGDVAFGVTLAGAPAGSNFGIYHYSAGDGRLTAVARSGDRVAGSTEFEYVGFLSQPIQLDDLGNIAFSAGIKRVGANEYAKAVVYGDMTTPGVVAHGRWVPREVSSSEPALYDSAWPLLLADGRLYVGQMTVNSFSFDGTTTTWSRKVGAELRPVLRSGDSAPLANYTFFQPAIADVASGAQLVVVDRLREGQTQKQRTSLLLGMPDEWKVVAQAGQEMPGFPVRTLLQDLTAAAQVNDAGLMVFEARLTGSAVNGAAPVALFIGTVDGMRPVAASGTPAPGMPEGVVFRGGGSARLTESGTVLLGTTLRDTASGAELSAVYVMEQAAAAPRPLFWEGGPVGVDIPEATGPVRFGRPSFLGVNNHGLVSVWATLEGEGIGEDYRALFISDLEGNAEAALRTGQLLEVNTEDWRTVRSFVPLSGIDDGNRILLTMSFTDDSSGLFVLTVPEPSVGLIGVLLATGLRRVRGGQRRRSVA